MGGDAAQRHDQRPGKQAHECRANPFGDPGRGIARQRARSSLRRHAARRAGDARRVVRSRRYLRAVRRHPRPSLEERYCDHYGYARRVSLLSLQVEAYAQVPPYPLDMLGAETEGPTNTKGTEGASVPI